jgi:hypothetical protein
MELRNAISRAEAATSLTSARELERAEPGEGCDEQARGRTLDRVQVIWQAAELSRSHRTRKSVYAKPAGSALDDVEGEAG